MSYEFHNTGSLDQNLRRIVADQLDKATQEIESQEIDRHEAVHQVRKRFKKLRSLARLVRPGLEERYSQINIWYRNAGRRLSRVRDTESMREAIERLCQQCSEQVDQSVFEAVRQSLQARQKRIADEWLDLNAQLTQLTEELHKRSEDLSDWSLSGGGVEIVLTGLSQCYKRGAQARVKAAARGTNQRLHNWRKRCKDHWYHMRLLARLWPTVMQARIAVCSELCDLLGDDHDLAMLTSLLEGNREELGGEVNVPALLGLVADRRRELQRQAFSLGRRVFAEKPRCLRRRLGAYWRIWRSEADRR